MKKYTVSLLVVVAFIFISCETTKKSDNKKVDEVSVETEELEKDTIVIDFKSLDFDGFLQQFKKAVSSKDKILFEKLTDLSDRSLYDIDQLKNQFDEIFNTTVVKEISEVNSSKMIHEVIGKDTVRILRVKSKMKIKGQMIDSTTILHFKKTDNGWKLFKTIVIE